VARYIATSWGMAHGAGGAATNLSLAIWNPAASGKLVRVLSIDFGSHTGTSTSALAFLRLHEIAAQPSGGTLLDGVRLDGAGAASAEVRCSSLANDNNSGDQIVVTGFDHTTADRMLAARASRNPATSYFRSGAPDALYPHGLGVEPVDPYTVARQEPWGPPSFLDEAIEFAAGAGLIVSDDNTSTGFKKILQVVWEEVSTGQTVAIAAVTQENLAQTLGRAKAKTVGAVTQPNDAQALAAAKTLAIAAAVTAHSAQALGRRKTLTIGVAAVQHLAQAVLVRPIKVTLGAATTAHAAQVLGRRKTASLSAATTTHLAQALGKAKQRVIAAATQLNSAQAVGRQKTKAIAAATTAHLARPLAKVKGIGHATTVHLAQPVATAGNKIVTVGVVTQPNTAQTLAKVKGIGRALTTHLAQALGRRKTRAVQAASETAQVQQLGRLKTRAVGTVTQPQAAQALGKAKRLTVAPAITVHTARAFIFPKTLLIGIVTTQHVAQALIFTPSFLPLGHAAGETNRVEVAGATARASAGSGPSGQASAARGKVRRR
jgi:hypothetical protein